MSGRTRRRMFAEVSRIYSHPHLPSMRSLSELPGGALEEACAKSEEEGDLAGLRAAIIAARNVRPKQ